MSKQMTWALAIVLAGGVALAEHPRKGAREAVPKAAKAVTLDFQHEIWGQTDKGNGFVYGPWNRTVGMTVVDIDLDGDNDFVLPSTIGNPQLMRNLGSSETFYPGGTRELGLAPLPQGMEFEIAMDFADLTGDQLPDLVCVTKSFSPNTKRVVWFRNAGPRHNPSFTYEGVVYTSKQSDSLPAMWVNLADINGDGLQDLFVVEAYLFEASRHHRVFLMLNQGNAAVPSFAEPVEITELSALLPDRLDVKALRAGDIRHDRDTCDHNDPKAAKQDVSYNLGDFELAYWDGDDVLDFMFYDRTEGLKWIKNVGTETNPVWDTQLGNGGRRCTTTTRSTISTIPSLRLRSAAIRRRPVRVRSGLTMYTFR